MGLEQLRNEILAKANREAAGIVAAAKKEAEGIMQQARQQASDAKKRASAEALKAAENLERREIAKATFEAKKHMLSKKQQIVDRVFHEAEKKVKALSLTKNKDYFASLLEKASGQVEISHLYINQKDKELAKDYKWLGASIMGGFIAENKDGSLRVDYSYETLLDNVRNKHLSSIVGILFG